MKKIVSVVLSAMLGISAVAMPSISAKAAQVPGNANLLNTYGKVLGRVGTALSEAEIMDNNKLNYAKNEYNSITAVNEMKPDYVLGWGPNLISVEEAKSLGYYIPDNYPESKVPRLNFNSVDKMMKACYEKGVKMRAHTLIWHGQTPDWYFKDGYNKYAGDVNQNVMNKRMEFFVKSYMNHVHSSQYGSVVYAWDVANEYLHGDAGANSGWQRVYGKNLKSRAPYIRQAFQYAYEALEAKGLTNSVKLFYNDYNTYMEVNDVVDLINYINQGKKVCAGIGMQSHLGTEFPSVGYYKAAMDAFRKAGFEIQITELDVGCKDFNTQAKYYYDLMRAILQEKKAGANITALVWWGMTDDTSWRDDKPLLYSSYGNKKPAYNAVLQAYFDEGFTMDGTVPTPTPDPKPDNPTPNPGETATLANGWYTIKNVHAQKYLTVKQNNGKAEENVELVQGLNIQGQKWYVNNLGNGVITLKSALGNFMLDVYRGEDKDGTNIEIYNAHGGNAQQFMLRKGSNGAYAIATKASNGSKVLDDYKLGTDNGTNVCQWSYNGNNNQQWIFEKTNN